MDSPGGRGSAGSAAGGGKEGKGTSTPECFTQREAGRVEENVGR